MKNFFEWKFYLSKTNNRKKVERLYKFYNESQYWSVEELKSYQHERFIEIFNFCKYNVPYYRKLFQEYKISSNDISCVEDLYKIPILTKKIIRTNIDKLKAINLENSRFISNSTSGTSGSNLKFFSDSESIHSKIALTLRRYEWMGVSLFDKEFNIWGASWDLKQNIYYARLKRLLNLENKINYSGYNLGDKNCVEIFDLLCKTNPKIIKSYPSILYNLSTFFEKNNLEFYPKTIHIGGEKLYDFQRLQIEKVFKAKVYDFYGARDMPNIAQNSSQFNGLHVFMENVILEVLDDNDQPIKEGEGNIALTGLNNFAMPFIRYKIGDRAKISLNRKCPSGRNLQIIDEVIGRTFDIIEFPNGNKVGGSFWTLLMRSVIGIKDFQVIQQEIDLITIKFTKEDFNCKVDTKQLLLNIQEYSGLKLKVNFIEVDKILNTKAGKMKFVESKIVNG